MTVKPITSFTIPTAQEPITFTEDQDGTIIITGLPVSPETQERLCDLLHLWKYGAIEVVETIAGYPVRTYESAFHR